MIRIGDVATRAGVSVRALRYYEEQGLLAPERSPSGQRLYPEAAADRVGLIRQLYAAGLSSRTIRTFLPCMDVGVSTPETMARLAGERERIDRQIRGLLDTRDRLDAVIAAASSATCAP